MTNKTRIPYKCKGCKKTRYLSKKPKTNYCRSCGCSKAKTKEVRAKLSKSSSNYFKKQRAIKYPIYKKRINDISKDFILWLTGFWEGEGWLSLRRNNQYISFGIKQKERHPLEVIKKYLKVGNIYFDKTSKTSSYIVSEKVFVILLLKRMKPFTISKKRLKEINYSLREVKI